MAGTTNKYPAPLTTRPPTWQSAGLLPPWQEVEHLVPSQAEILKMFGRKQPAPIFADRIRYFIGCQKHSIIAARRRKQMQADKEVQDALRNMRSAIADYERATARLEAIPAYLKSLSFPQSAEQFAQRIRDDMAFLQASLSPEPQQKEWRFLANWALDCVIDPALQAIGLNFRATSAQSVRVRLLSYVVRCCGIPNTEASEGAIREWLKGKERPPSPFLSYRRTGT